MVIRPLEGWALDAVVELDQHRPGFAGSYLRASDERRQVVAAFLAVADTQARAQTDTAQFLAETDHCAILAKAFGSVPVGMRGALKRCGPQPLGRGFYKLLHQTMTAPPHAAAIRAIQHINRLDLERLRITRRLPETICSVELATHLRGVSELRALIAALDLLVSHGINASSLHTAVRACSSNQALERCIRRWSMKLDLPPHPVPPTASYHPILTVADLHRSGQRYRNCMARYTVGVLEGSDSFALFEPRQGVRGLVVHLRQESKTWRLQDCFGPSNSMPPPSLRDEAEQYLATQGIARRVREPRRISAWSALDRFVQTSLFDAEDVWVR